MKHLIFIQNNVVPNKGKKIVLQYLQIFFFHNLSALTGFDGCSLCEILFGKPFFWHFVITIVFVPIGWTPGMRQISKISSSNLPPIVAKMKYTTE